MRNHSGFTLVEMIMAIVITGILAGIVAIFISGPISGYVDTARRAELSDIADLALKRISLEVRTAIPNSIRISTSTASTTSCTATATSNCYLEFIPSITSGRYCTDLELCPSGPDGKLDFAASADYFDVLGPPHGITTADFLVINNTTANGATSAYAGYTMRAVSSITPVAPSTNGLTFSGSAFPASSPYFRFQVAPSSGPLTFSCEGVATGSSGSGTLRRYASYATSLPFGNQPTPTGGGALLADTISACSMEYMADLGLVEITLQLTREGESVILWKQIHVDNAN